MATTLKRHQRNGANFMNCGWVFMTSCATSPYGLYVLLLLPDISGASYMHHFLWYEAHDHRSNWLYLLAVFVDRWVSQALLHLQASLSGEWSPGCQSWCKVRISPVAEWRYLLISFLQTNNIKILTKQDRAEHNDSLQALYNHTQTGMVYTNVN